MKRRILCLLLVLSLLLCACDAVNAGNENTAPPDETTKAENETLAVPEPGGEPDTPNSFGLAYVPSYGFNPYSCTCITNRPVLSLVYEGLFVLSGRFEPEPVLCDSFSVSEDGKHYVFTICPEAVFSDGSPVTAADAVASLTAARDSDYYGTRFSRVSSFTAKNEKTLLIDLLTPYENLPLLLDVPIVRADAVGDSRPVGSGPYVFFGESALARNRNWWQDRAAPVEFDRITLTAAKNPTEVRDSFEFGQTSLVCADLNSPTAVGYRCDFELWDSPTTTMQYIGFNCLSGMFVNRDFRAGVTHIIDRSAITTSVFKGFAKAACLPCSPESGLYDDTLAAAYQYDPAAFAEAMQHANISPEYVGTLLVCSADPKRVETAHRIAEMLTDAGAKVEVASVDYDTYQYRLRAGQFDCFIGETRLSASFDLSEFFKPYGALSFGGIQSGAMLELCAAALENSGNCYDLYRNVMEQGYFCPLLFKSYAVMANRGSIRSLQPAVDNVFHLSGGRTLSDAGASYEALTAEPTEPAETSPDASAGTQAP